MSSAAAAPPEHVAAKRGALTGGALSDEAFDSSPSLLRPARSGNQVAGLQQYFTPPEAAQLVAAVNGTTASTVDLTAGDGSLLAGVDPGLRFGIEIDPDHIDSKFYEPIQGDVQAAFPLLRLLGSKFPRVACNPPFGLDWKPNGRRENSTIATWRMAVALMAPDGAGAFIAGRDRFLRDVLTRPDASGVYALVECEDLFDGVTLPCVLAFFVAPGAIEEPRGGGPLRLSSERADLRTLAAEIVAERQSLGVHIIAPFRCAARARLVDHFQAVSRELASRRQEAARNRQRFDLTLRGQRISSRPSPFSRLALGERKVLRNVERLNGQPPTYFALYADPRVMPTLGRQAAPKAGIAPVRSA